MIASPRLRLVSSVYFSNGVSQPSLETQHGLINLSLQLNFLIKATLNIPFSNSSLIRHKLRKQVLIASSLAKGQGRREGKAYPGCLSGCTWDLNFSRRALVCLCHKLLQLLSLQCGRVSANVWITRRGPLCVLNTLKGGGKEPENRMLSQITEVGPVWGLEVSRVCGDRQQKSFQK